MKALKPSKKNQNITIKIPYRLYRYIQDLKNIEPNLTFNVSEICKEALESYLKIARKELNEIKSGKSPVLDSQEKSMTQPQEER